MWLVRCGLLLDPVCLYCPHEIEIKIWRRQGQQSLLPVYTRRHSIRVCVCRPSSRATNKASAWQAEFWSLELKHENYWEVNITEAYKYFLQECKRYIIAYQDLRKSVEIGLCLTCKTDCWSAKSPNEWGCGEILPFITLSQVTQHSEHFPATQEPTSVKRKKKMTVCTFLQTCVCVRNHRVCAHAAPSTNSPNRLCLLSCFMYLCC